MSELTTVARPYARAAFEFSLENNNVEAWADMLSFAASVASNATMAELLKGEKAAQELANLFVEVCEGQLDENGLNFINVMAKNGRLSVLPRIAELFADLQAELKEEIDVKVISAYALSKPQQKELSESLEKRLALKVNLNCSTDKSLIAGMVITAGDLVIDSSTLGQLNRLSDSLQS